MLCILLDRGIAPVLPSFHGVASASAIVIPNCLYAPVGAILREAVSLRCNMLPEGAMG